MSRWPLTCCSTPARWPLERTMSSCRWARGKRLLPCAQGPLESSWGAARPEGCQACVTPRLSPDCFSPGPRFVPWPPLGRGPPWNPSISPYSGTPVFTSHLHINLLVAVWSLTLPGPASPWGIDSSLALIVFRANVLCYFYQPLFLWRSSPGKQGLVEITEVLQCGRGCHQLP